MRPFASHALRRLAWVALALSLTACRTDLITQIPENDTNEVLDALYSAGIDAGKVGAGDKQFTVQVAEAQMGDALRVLQERGLPRPKHSDLGTLFKKEGLVSTPSEERVRFLYGVAQQLSGTLSQIPGVLWASVQPVMPANDPLADKVKPSSASVLIKYDPNFNVQALQPAIKDFIARSIEGLAHDNITLTMVAAEPPQRVARAEPVLPTWVVTSLSLLAGVAVLAAGAAGFLWLRMQRLAAAREAGDDAAWDPDADGAPGDFLARLRLAWRTLIGARDTGEGEEAGGGRAATNEPHFEALRSMPASKKTVPTS
jgi:type III secretion protein J